MTTLLLSRSLTLEYLANFNAEISNNAIHSLSKSNSAMLSPNQNLQKLLAKGNLESALETLVRLNQESDDADLRQRLLEKTT